MNRQLMQQGQLWEILRRLKKLCRKLPHRIRMKYSVAKYKFKKFIKNRNTLPEEYYASQVLFETDKALGPHQWIFHDENWVRVKHRSAHRRMVAAGSPLRITDNMQEPTKEVTFLEDGTMRFDGKTETMDEWICLYLDPQKYQWDNYSWKFSIQRDTYFREFQFAFRYQDFYNRYRFRFENDYIYFDKHIKGVFYSGLNSVPFHMDLRVPYDVRIDAYGNNFRCYISGTLMMNEFDFDNTLPIGSIAIILWEKNGVTDMKAAVGPMCVYQLLKNQTRVPERKSS